MIKYLIPEIYLPIVFISSAIVTYFISCKIVDRILNIKIGYLDIKDKRRKTLNQVLKNMIKYLIFIILVVAILNVFNIDTKALITGLGLVGLVIGLALQDIIKDFLAGLFIIFDDKYGVGDIIEINGYKGEVVSLGLKTTRIKNIDGNIKIFLNRNIIEVINYSINNSRVVLEVSINRNEKIEEIEKLLNNITNNLENEIDFVIGKIKLLGINKIEPTSISFTIVTETKPMKYPIVQRELIKKIIIELDKKKIEVVSIIGGNL
jgi:moderate conductance mechanosensitive channel